MIWPWDGDPAVTSVDLRVTYPAARAEDEKIQQVTLRKSDTEQVTFLKEDAEQKRRRKVMPDGIPDPTVEIRTDTRIVKPPERYVCRVCHGEGASGHYCPTCLAETMEPFSP